MGSVAYPKYSSKLYLTAYQSVDNKVILNNYLVLKQQDIKEFQELNTTNILQLSLKSCNIERVKLEILMKTRLNSLEILDLSQNKIKSDDCNFLSQIKQLGSLKTLILDHNRIQNQGLKHLQNMRLQDLSLNYCKITTQGCTALSGMKNIAYLSLIGNQLTDQIQKYIKQLSQLVFLNLSNNCITNEGFQSILNIKYPHLKSLFMQRNRIDLPKQQFSHNKDLLLLF